MDGLHIDGELTAVVADDKNTDAATASLEGLGETAPQVGLIDDRQRLLDITSLSHGNNYEGLADEGGDGHEQLTGAVLEVENTVLLEDRAKHCLHYDTWARVGDE